MKKSKSVYVYVLEKGKETKIDITCPVCDGYKGYQPEHGEYEPCTNCKGKGYVKK